MAIRIKCDLEGFDKCWVDFRDHSWPFGDRRKMLEGGTDIESVVLPLRILRLFHRIFVRSGPQSPSQDISNENPLISVNDKSFPQQKFIFDLSPISG